MENNKLNKDNRNNRKNWKYCSVPQCKPTPNTSKHSFPKNKRLKKKWKIACRIKCKITDNLVLCSKHFKQEDYRRSSKSMYYLFLLMSKSVKNVSTGYFWCDSGQISKKPKLIPNAVPSENLPIRSCDRVLTTYKLLEIEARNTRYLKRKLMLK